MALLVGAAAMVLRYVLDRRGGQARTALVHEVEVKPARTVAIGMVGGLIVGLTSVGSGSLMIVLLLFLYPMLGANQLVGTDLSQAVPLTLAAALGALAFGHVDFGVTASLIIGSVPAVLLGSVLSSSAPDRYIRPAITFVIFASGLKYVGVSTQALGWILCATLFAAGLTWALYKRPWQTSSEADVAGVEATAAPGTGARSGPRARPRVPQLAPRRGLRAADSSARPTCRAAACWYRSRG